jgi:hypothetical protein
MENIAPVLLITFNRPDTTEKVFAAIRAAKPSKLFIASDGARQGKSGEAEKVAAVRQLVSQVDWECEVQTLFRDKNLGCKYGVAGAIDWFLQHVEEGIILEDDCLPHPDFFTFATKMLKYYRQDERMMAINGSNFQQGIQRGDGSYFFGRLPHVWGWATWRRAWALRDLEMQTYTEFKQQNKIADVFANAEAQNLFTGMFDEVRAGRDTWDYQWVYTILANQGLTINPNVNLISNIGFDSSATHTKEPTHMSGLPTQALTDVKHPSFVVVDRGAETQVLRYVFGVQSVDGNLVNRYLKKIWRRLRRAAASAAAQ